MYPTNIHIGPDFTDKGDFKETGVHWPHAWFNNPLPPSNMLTRNHACICTC